MKLHEIINKLEELYPTSLALSWDNVGLIIKSNDEINKVMITLDVTTDVIKQAITNKVDFIITHHPILFNETKTIIDTTVDGNFIKLLLQNNISLYAMHTNFDIHENGMSKAFASKLGIKDYTRDYEDTAFCFNFGDSFDQLLQELGPIVPKGINIKKGRHYNVDNHLINKVGKVCVVPGSGGSAVYSLDCDVLVTGDIKHHDIIYANEKNMAVIDISHYAESLFKPYLQSILKQHIDIEIILSKEQIIIKG